MIRTVLSLALAAFCTAAGAQYPSKPIRLIVPFPAGGAAELGARIVSQPLAQALGQPVIVEPKPGGDGVIAADVVMKSAADGYTLFYPTSTAFSWVPVTHKKPPYDPVADFTPVSLVGFFGFFLFTHPSVPANSVAELLAYARANPGKLNYASQGTTTVSFLTTEMFMTMAGALKITHVPYKGTAPGLAAILAGEVELMFDNLGVTLPHVRSGKLKALAVCGERRVASLPDVPAMAEIYPGFVSVAWFGVVAPPKTPASIAEKLSAAIAETLKLPDVAARLANLSAEPIASTPAGMAAIMEADAERWRAVIRAAGVKPE